VARKRATTERLDSWWDGLAEELGVKPTNERPTLPPHLIPSPTETPQAFLSRTLPGTLIPNGDRHRAVWEWGQAIESGQPATPRVEIWGRGGAKCLDANTMLSLLDGSLAPISEIKPGEKILSWNEASGQIEGDSIIAKVFSGIKPCIQVTTATGKSVVLTSDHKVRTFDGWKLAGELTLQDRIASPRHLKSVSAVIDRPDEEVKLLAYMIAEGSTTSNNCSFTNADECIVRDFIYCANAMGMEVKRCGIYGYNLKGFGRQWIKNVGIKDKLATQKRVPKFVFQLPERQKWIFLAAMFDTDGWVEERKMGIALANQALVKDLEILLAQVGVISSTIEAPNDYAGAWRLMIDQNCLSRCRDMMPLILKKEKLQKVCEKHRYSLFDTYPRQVGLGLPKGTNRKIRNAGGPRLGKDYDITRGKLQKAITYEPLPQWVWLEKADVFWDKVVKIEDVGDRETYDVQVERNQNLITNLLVTHNSTIAEQLCAYFACSLKRRLALYVCGTQDQADLHVQAIAALLEQMGVPRALNKYSASLNWTAQRLQTVNGFGVVGVGLNSRIRGARIQEQRPDLIILDDIDGTHDTPEATAKKLKTISRDILAAESTDATVLFVQNKIHKDSAIAQVADGRAEILLGATVTEEPAAIDLEYEQYWSDQKKQNLYRVSGGKPTWPEGQNLEVIERQINKWGLRTFLTESQHEDEPDGGLWDKDRDITPYRVTSTPELIRIVIGVDPSGSSTTEAGNVAVGKAASGHLYVLNDDSLKGTPNERFQAVIDRYHDLKANYLVAERNFGGDMVKATVLLIDPTVAVKESTSSRGKLIRAEPAHQQYEAGKVHHVGTFVDLEREMCTWQPGMPSPNRLDALVFAINDLIEGTAVDTLNALYS